MDNVEQFPNVALIKTQASEWLFRMDHEALSGEARKEFQDWIGQSDFHRDYFLKLVKQWESMSVLEELADLFPLPEKQGQAKRSSWLRGFGVAPLLGSALASCVLLVAIVLNLPTDDSLRQEFFTARGEQASFELPDGSRIVLNTNTALSMDYSGPRRQIELIRGEANFEVHKDATRPFVVRANRGLVWAVGTAFNVRNTGREVDVTVTEGRVKVFADIPSEGDGLLALELGKTSQQASDRSNKEAVAGAGETLKIKEAIEAHGALQAEALARKLSWQKGVIIFDGETLAEAVEEISRYTDLELVVGASIKNMRIGGHYKTDDIDALLLTLSHSFNIKIERVSEKRIRLTAN